MSLRFALLALLSSRPMTGYDLSKHFSQSVAHVWHAPDSQIYPELNRMQRDGLLEAVPVRWGPKGTKKEYRVTDAGLAAFRDWMNEPLEIRRQRDPAYLKAAYLEWADAEAARSQLRQHLDHWSAHLALLEDTRQTLLDHTHPTLTHRLSRFPSEEHERIVRYKVFAYDGLVDQARAEVAWAERGLALVDELEGEARVEAAVVAHGSD
jgi:PadR family transcriptional regulator, regulator of vanillate utilization